MIEPLTGFHEMRSNPQIMINGKAAPFFLPNQEVMPGNSSDSEETPRAQHLSVEATRVLKEMELRDNAVRQEEESHARMLGRHAGAIKYEYQIGPDGRAYVINGSVEVDPKISSTNPEEIRKVLQKIQRAAVSVSNPSQADLNVAASAATKVSFLSEQQMVDTYRNGVELQTESLDTPSNISVSSQLDTLA